MSEIEKIAELIKRENEHYLLDQHIDTLKLYVDVIGIIKYSLTSSEHLKQLEKLIIFIISKKEQTEKERNEKQRRKEKMK